MHQALNVRSFGPHGIGREQPLSGPHALRDYCRRCTGVQITRYSPAGRRMTHRGAIELTLTMPDGTTRTVTVAARRRPQPLPLWHVFELRDGHAREYGAAADPRAAEAMARAAVEDGASVAEVMSPDGDVAMTITPDMLTDRDTPCTVCYGLGQWRSAHDGALHDCECVSAPDEWTPAATIDPEDDGAYHELAPMPTPRLHLEPQPVPLTQATFV